MKTTYIIAAVLATILFTQPAAAKLGATVEVNIQDEITYNINKMLSNVQAPTIKADVAQNLKKNQLQLQTNELVQNVGKELPEFKFKVIIAE